MADGRYRPGHAARRSVPLLGIAAGAGGIVLGLLAIRKAEEGLAANRGLALAGAICGAVGALLTILFVLVNRWVASLPY